MGIYRTTSYTFTLSSINNAMLWFTTLLASALFRKTSFANNDFTNQVEGAGGGGQGKLGKGLKHIKLHCEGIGAFYIT